MSKGKKKTQFNCKRNDDDLRDKIVQVKKVVHNRSKTDIALVLQSCEQCDNAVDTAIAKLIGPDKGQDCLKEWEVKAKKSKKSKKSTDGKGNTFTASSSSSASSEESVSHTNEHPIKSEEDKQSPTPASPVSTALAPEAGPAQSTSPTKPPLIDPDTKTKSYNKKPKQRRPIKKPRPPKRIREKLKVMAEAAAAEAAAAASKNNSESPSTTSEIVYEPEPLSPESGIMTASTSLSSSPVSKEPAADLPVTNLPLPPKGRPQQERHSPSEPSLRKLIKDLHRCDIALTRYQQNLQEQCSVAARNLERTFNTLRIGINAREEDLRCELRNVQQTAQLLLQRRKATAIALRRLTESANQLEEAQIAELKKQLKCFISDRKVDEAVGNLNRFYGDPDDLLPSVTKFGKVVTVQETYSSWNENPHAAIEKSSIKVCLPQLVLPKLSHNDHNIIAAATAAAMVFQPRFCLPPLLPPFPLPPFLRPEIGIPFPLPRPIINTNGVFCGFTNQSMPPGRLALPQHPMPVANVPSQVENAYPYKYSPEFLAVFQERVRNSLYRQGVCLYDPLTGKAVRPNPPPPLVPPVPPVPPPSHTVPTSSSSNHNNNNNDAKKKTPTQQRRDRKRRQKEREKREKNSKSDANSSCNGLPNSNNKANSHNSSSQSHHNTSNSNTSGHVAANNGDIKSHSSSSSSSPHTQTSNKVGKPISRKVTWIKRYKRYGSKEYEKKSPTSLGEGPPPPPPPPAVSQMKPIATKSQKSTPPIVSTSPEPDVSKKGENPSLATSNDPTPQEQEKLPTATLEDEPVSSKEETVSQKECIITVAKEDTCAIMSNDEEPPPLFAEEKFPSTMLKEESTEATSHDECSNE